MKTPKCPNCKAKTQLVLCWYKEPQQSYFCQTCRRHCPK